MLLIEKKKCPYESRYKMRLRVIFCCEKLFHFVVVVFVENHIDWESQYSIDIVYLRFTYIQLELFHAHFSFCSSLSLYLPLNMFIGFVPVRRRLSRDETEIVLHKRNINQNELIKLYRGVCVAFSTIFD